LKCFFDTSVLIPVFFDEHIHHEASLSALRKASRKDSYCSAHTLAEIYSSLTRMPGHFRTTPDEALLLLQDLRERFAVIALDEKDYWATLEQCRELGIEGGTVYDALIARCAVKAQADVLYTWNLSHFNRLGPEVARRVRTP
jgi:predicted nucleic acid-binding protein